MADYKKNYNKNFTDYTSFYNDLSTSFKDYGKYLEKKANQNTIDILIVVDMFLTGYDSPFTQALFVDKNLYYHNLIQSFSRTNRLAAGKNYANIIDFNNLKMKQIKQ
jgi:type I restriction enzyme R subunit